MPFTPNPKKEINIKAIEKLLNDNNLTYDITLVTDHSILVNIEVMPKDYVEAEEDRMKKHKHEECRKRRVYMYICSKTLNIILKFIC